MCNCHSYNWGVGSEVGRMLEFDGKMVCIDACITDTVIALNEAGFTTIASCCGHNRLKPSILLADTLSVKQCTEAKRLLQKIDTRDIDLVQWRRVVVADTVEYNNSREIFRAIKEMPFSSRGYSLRNSKRIRKMIKKGGE